MGCASHSALDNTNTQINALDTEVTKLNLAVNTLKSQNTELVNSIYKLNSLLAEYNSKNNTNITPVAIPENTSNQGAVPSAVPLGGQCMAITQAGTQCKRTSVPGSDFCWQHQTGSVSKPSNPGGHDIQTGPRGGQYYINKNGKKTYIKKK